VLRPPTGKRADRQAAVRRGSLPEIGWSVNANLAMPSPCHYAHDLPTQTLMIHVLADDIKEQEGPDSCAARRLRASVSLCVLPLNLNGFEVLRRVREQQQAPFAGTLDQKRTPMVQSPWAPHNRPDQMVPRMHNPDITPLQSVTTAPGSVTRNLLTFDCVLFGGALQRQLHWLRRTPTSRPRALEWLSRLSLIYYR
jgi:hypothetical protein